MFIFSEIRLRECFLGPIDRFHRIGFPAKLLRDRSQRNRKRSTCPQRTVQGDFLFFASGCPEDMGGARVRKGEGVHEGKDREIW